MARLGVSFCRKREVTEGGGVIQNIPEQSGIAGGGIGLRSLPAANQGASQGEVGQPQCAVPPHTACVRPLEAGPGGSPSPEGEQVWGTPEGGGKGQEWCMWGKKGTIWGRFGLPLPEERSRTSERLRWEEAGVR